MSTTKNLKLYLSMYPITNISKFESTRIQVQIMLLILSFHLMVLYDRNTCTRTSKCEEKEPHMETYHTETDVAQIQSHRLEVNSLVLYHYAIRMPADQYK